MSNRITGSLFLTFLGFLFIFSACRERHAVNEKNISGKDTLTVLLKDITQKIADHPSDPILLQQRSKYYLLDHQEKNAFADITKAISMSPNSASLYITLSDVYLEMGKPDNCDEALLKAISLDPHSNPALIRIAKLSLIIKDYKATFDYLKKAIDAQPHNPEAYFTRALALLEKGDTVEAVEDLKRTVDQDQGFYDAYVELGELYAMRKDPVAADYLKNAIRIHPASTEALYNLGLFYQETGSYQEALDTYAKLEATDSTFKDAPYNSGYIYMVYLHDFSKAVKYFSLALQKDPGYIAALFNRGYAYELEGEYSKAYADYKHVLDLNTNYQKAIDGMNRIDKIRGS